MRIMVEQCESRTMLSVSVRPPRDLYIPLPAVLRVIAPPMDQIPPLPYIPIKTLCLK